MTNLDVIQKQRKLGDRLFLSFLSSYKTLYIWILSKNKDQWGKDKEYKKCKEWNMFWFNTNVYDFLDSLQALRLLLHNPSKWSRLAAKSWVKETIDNSP